VSVGVFGCLILASTNNLFGAVTGVLLCGGGFSATLPLAIERIGSRFPYFHPGFFNGIFSIALTGGALAPASVGLYAHWLGSENWLGINVVLAVPMIGSMIVLLLALLIFLEAHLTASAKLA
jgi:hypothetical protein